MAEASDKPIQNAKDSAQQAAKAEVISTPARRYRTYLFMIGLIAIFGAFRIRSAENAAKQVSQAVPAARTGAVPAVETMVAKTEAAGAGVVSSAGAGVAAAGAGAAAAGATAFAAAQSVVEETKEQAVDVAETVSDKVAIEALPEHRAHGDLVPGVDSGVPYAIATGRGRALTD